MCEPYSPEEMADLVFQIRMEVMNGDKHEANRMLIALSNSLHIGPKEG